MRSDVDYTHNSSSHSLIYIYLTNIVVVFPLLSFCWMLSVSNMFCSLGNCNVSVSCVYSISNENLLLLLFPHKTDIL